MQHTAKVGFFEIGPQQAIQKFTSVAWQIIARHPTLPDTSPSKSNSASRRTIRWTEPSPPPFGGCEGGWSACVPRAVFRVLAGNRPRMSLSRLDSLRRMICLASALPSFPCLHGLSLGLPRCLFSFYSRMFVGRGLKRAGLRLVALDGKIALMTATLTLDNSGRLLLPAQILRVLGMQPGVEMKVEVSRGRIELLGEQDDDVPLITELSPEGKLVFPAGVQPPSAEKIVAAIKSDREDRIHKLSRR